METSWSAAEAYNASKAWRWRYLDPMEWLTWIHGKLFANHPVFGGIVACTIGAVLAGVLYLRVLDKYNTEHPTPKVEAVAGNQGNPPAAKVEATPQPQTQTSIEQAKHPVAITGQSKKPATTTPNSSPSKPLVLRPPEETKQSGGPTIFRSAILGPPSSTLEIGSDSNVIANVFGPMNVKIGDRALVYRNYFAGQQTEVTDAQRLEILGQLHEELRKVYWKDLPPEALQQKEKMFDEFASDVKKRALTPNQVEAILNALTDVSSQQSPNKP